MNQPKSTEERLKELGWHDVATREKATLQQQGAEGANDLYKAFEHKTMGTVFCYSSKEAETFLRQLEGPTIDQSAYTEHMAEILYRKITHEEAYLSEQNIPLTSDDIFESLCEIVKQLSDIPGIRERIEKLS